MGYRFRLHRKDLPGKPDIVLPKYKTVVFIHGCFWHACPFHFRLPRSNSQYWEMKISRNKHRYKEVIRKLRLDGWTVVRIWEHQLACETKLIRCIRSAILKRRGD
jgi:DNA mismatch endonuclease (patch repair protein)